MFLEVEEGGQDQDDEAVKVYLIRFIADLKCCDVILKSLHKLVYWVPCHRIITGYLQNQSGFL